MESGTAVVVDLLQMNLRSVGVWGGCKLSLGAKV